MDQTRHPGEVLAAMQSDLDRAMYCERRAAAARDEWYDQERAHVEKMVGFLGNDGKSDPGMRARYGHMSEKTRRQQAELNWSKSTPAKTLASTEQQYSRWATMYYLAHLAKTAARPPIVIDNLSGIQAAVKEGTLERDTRGDWERQADAAVALTRPKRKPRPRPYGEG